MLNNTSNKARLTLRASFAICALVAGIPGSAYAAENTPQSAMSHDASAGGKMIRSESPEGRVKHLHDMLKITAAEETQWHGVAQVMLDNASAIDSAIKDRVRMSKGMTAIDDLKSYQAIVEAHAQGIKKLAIAFRPLYASMPEEQQKNADAVFGHRTEPSKLITK
jgi:periplasmic protein CpxP/Spy